MDENELDFVKNMDGSKKSVKIDMHVLLTTLAVLISVASLFYTNRSNKANLKATAYSNLIESSQIQEKLLIDNPEFLQMHGISKSELKAIGASEKEVIYVLSEIRADLMYYRAAGFDAEEVPTEYRRTMLDNQKFQSIYKTILHQRLFSPGPYTCELDLYLIEKSAPKGEWYCDGKAKFPQER